MQVKEEEEKEEDEGKDKEGGLQKRKTGRRKGRKIEGGGERG